MTTLSRTSSSRSPKNRSSRRTEVLHSGCSDGQAPSSSRPSDTGADAGTATGADCRNRSVDVALPVAPIRIAELALEDLPGGVARQHLDEIDRGRALVVGQAVAGGGEDVGHQGLVVMGRIGRS